MSQNNHKIKLTTYIFLTKFSIIKLGNFTLYNKLTIASLVSIAGQFTLHNNYIKLIKLGDLLELSTTMYTQKLVQLLCVFNIKHFIFR